MNERKLGEVGSRLLLENERVRVWELRLEPGEESDLHEHRLDYVLIQVAGDRIAWVVGFQIDDRFKVTPQTRRVLVLSKEMP